MAGSAVVMVGVACLAALLAGCDSDRQRGKSMVVQRGGDLIGSGGTIRIADSVPGDVMLAGGEIEFSGQAGGDYLGAGGDQQISGRVGGSARVAGGNVLVSSVVARNATIAGGNVELRRNGIVEGNAYLAGGNVVVAGTVRQLLRVSGGAVNISGSTGGDVNVEAQRLRVGRDARIDGDLRYRVSAENVEIDSAAIITGRTIALPIRDWAAVWNIVRLIWGLGFLLAGALLIAVFPALAITATDGVRTRPGVSAGLGVMWIILVPIVIVLAAVTVIGVPLAMLLTGAYLIVLYLAGIVLALFIGRLALRGLARDGRGRLVLAFLLGGVLLLMASWIPVLGWLVILVAIVLGSGALLLPIAARARARASA